MHGCSFMVRQYLLSNHGDIDILVILLDYIYFHFFEVIVILGFSKEKVKLLFRFHLGLKQAQENC